MKSFYKSVLKLSIPIALQQLISFSVNFVDTFMMGYLGEIEIASAGIANKYIFFFSGILFGLSSGGSIFISQFWGKKDKGNISKSMGLMALIALSISIIFFIPGFFFSKMTINVFSPDPKVIFKGIKYLKIVSISIPIMALNLVFETALRSTEKAFLPMFTSIVAVNTNIFLNYVFMFGKFGMPRLEIVGAALGTLVSRILQLTIIVLITYSKKYTARFYFSDIKKINKKFYSKYMNISKPAIANEFLWSLGITLYSVVYAHMGTDIIASRNIMETIESMAFTLLFALGSSTAVLVGKELGVSNYDYAFKISKKLLHFSILLSIVISIVVISFSGSIASIFKVSQNVQDLIKNSVIIAMIFLPARTISLVSGVGILRSGGDTKFTFYIESASLWLIGIPCAVILGLVVKLPYLIVYPLTLIEEIIKGIFFIKRINSKKWVKNLIKNI